DRVARGVLDHARLDVGELPAARGHALAPFLVAVAQERPVERPNLREHAPQREEIRRGGESAVFDVLLLLEVNERVELLDDTRRVATSSEADDRTGDDADALAVCEATDARCDPLRRRNAVRVREREHLAPRQGHACIAGRIRAWRPLRDQAGTSGASRFDEAA